ELYAIAVSVRGYLHRSRTRGYRHWPRAGGQRHRGEQLVRTDDGNGRVLRRRCARDGRLLAAEPRFRFARRSAAGALRQIKGLWHLAERSRRDSHGGTQGERSVLVRSEGARLRLQ